MDEINWKKTILYCLIYWVSIGVIWILLDHFTKL